MIEVASYPADLATWDPSQQPFYLEVFGETRPRVDTSYAEVTPVGPRERSESAAAPIYEYWWTIGHPGFPDEMRHWWDILGTPSQHDRFWANLQDPAARVYFFFPLQGGWRIKELVATVKYLRPALKLEGLKEKAAQDWTKVAPVVGEVSSAASMVPFPAVADAATALSAIAKLQINSVPPTDDFNWSVGKVTFGTKAHGVSQGIVWRLPKRMFLELGGRITGSLALSFIPSPPQKDQRVSSGPPVFEPQPLLAHAVVYGADNPIWAPGQRDFVKLQLAPIGPARVG